MCRVNLDTLPTYHPFRKSLYNKAKQWTPQRVTLFVPKSPPSCSAIVSGVKSQENEPMKVLLGSNTINDCDAALVVNNEEVFRLRERLGDGRLVCDFDVRDQSGNRLAKIAKNNVVHAAEGYSVKNLERESYIEGPSGEIVAKVEEIAMDVIKVTGTFSIDHHTVVITDESLVSGGMTMSGNVISGFKKAIAINPNSFAIGTA
jgi:hypothetical protein